MRAATALLVSLGLTLGALDVRAESPAELEEARQLFVEGWKLALRGSWAEARDRYERSLGLKRAAITLYSLGVAQRSTGQLVEALGSFRAFVAEPSAPGTASYEQPARQAIEELQREVGRLRIALAPAQAKVAVELDGKRASPGADALLVNPGPHRVRASAPGAGEATVDLVVAPGATQEVGLRLALPARPPAERPPPPASPSRALPFTLLGAGAVAFGTGLGLGIAGLSRASSAGSSGFEADRARSLALAADVVGGVGLAAMAAGGAVLLFTPRPAAKPAPARASIAPFVAGASCGLAGTF
jgi:hypothetical protein